MRRIVTALLCLAAAPVPAGAAEVGTQVERTAPAKYPEDLAGCSPRCVRGRTIPRGTVLLSRRVRLDAGDRRVNVSFACPGRRVFRTFGHLEAGDVVLQIPDSQFPYRGRSRIRAVGERGISPVRSVARGTLYALCVRR